MIPVGPNSFGGVHKRLMRMNSHLQTTCGSNGNLVGRHWRNRVTPVYVLVASNHLKDPRWYRDGVSTASGVIFGGKEPSGCLSHFGG